MRTRKATQRHAWQGRLAGSCPSSFRLPPSAFRLVLASLVYHGRMNLAVACGVAVGTAVLTGALLVGDSMRGSLRRLTLDRLGRIEEVLVADRFFRAKLADELAAEPGFSRCAAAAVPVILLRASLENADPQSPARANQVNLIGCDERFWELGAAAGGPPGSACRAGAKSCSTSRWPSNSACSVGDAVMVHLPKPGAIPAESTLGRTRDDPRPAADRLGHRPGGRAGALRPAAQPAAAPQCLRFAGGPANATRARPGRANALLVAGSSRRRDSPRRKTTRRCSGCCGRRWPITGCRCERTARGYLNLTSDRMILAGGGSGRSSDQPPRRGGFRSAGAGLPGQPDRRRPAHNPLLDGRRAGFHRRAAVGTVSRRRGKPLPPLADDQIVLNSWAAEQLGAAARRRGPHHLLRSQARRRTTSAKPRSTLRLAGIVALERRGRRPGPGAAAAGRDRSADDARLGSALPVRSPADRPRGQGVLEAARRHAQGVCLAGHRPAAVGQPFRPDHVAADQRRNKGEGGRRKAEEPMPIATLRLPPFRPPTRRRWASSSSR